MKNFAICFRSEFYKSRKTLGFWSAVLLPVTITTLVFIGFVNNSALLSKLSPMLVWIRFSQTILAVMGWLLLPMLIIFITYSVNSIEHKADAWKTLFTYPVSKLSVYSAKFFYALSLIFLCLFLFAVFTLIWGNLLGTIKPDLKFHEYHFEALLSQIYLKLFISVLGILSIQFLLSLLWADFLKPMGLGFAATIIAIIWCNTKIKYSYLFPYASPQLSLHNALTYVKGLPVLYINLLSPDMITSLVCAVGFFILGYFIILKRSVL